MSLLIALIPALAWGSTGIVTTKAGGTVAQGIMGIALGAIILGFGTLIFFVIPHAGISYAFNLHIWITGFVTGLIWAVGQVGQLIGYKKLGVSVGNPLSTSGQLIGNALMAAAILGEWHTNRMWLLGVFSIILITTGAVLTTKQDKHHPIRPNNEYDFKAGFIAITVSTLAFTVYFVLPNLLNKWRFISDSIHSQHHGLDYMTAIVAPQSIGQLLGAWLIVAFYFRETQNIFKIGTLRQISTGLVWALGNVFMFISTGNPNIGQATAATLSQTGIIVGIFGAIFVLGERKTRYQIKYISLGIILVISGAIIISQLSTI